MRQETNNEIDLLLRRLGRRADSGVSDPDAGHLDADELNSYAENVLPAVARARYTEHLAECSSCRNLVVQLSSAAGVVVAPERAVVPAPSGLRNFLASLFSPLVLRYAIPALGLAVIAVIGFTVFRTDQSAGNDVAQRSSGPASANEQVKAPSTGYSSDSKLDDSKSAQSATPDAGTINMSKAPAPAPPAGEKISAPTGDANAAAAEPPPSRTEAQPVIANTPASSPTPMAKATEINDRKVQELEAQKKEVDRLRQLEAAREPKRESAYAQSKDEARRSANEAAPPAAAGTQSAPAGKPKEDLAKARSQRGTGTGTFHTAGPGDRDDAETRTVAGRRFRRQRSVWIDTAYSSSTETMDLTRGSERFRALVADEPAIKTIADQLDGEIIVVWKGRAYRIR